PMLMRRRLRHRNESIQELPMSRGRSGFASLTLVLIFAPAGRSQNRAPANPMAHEILKQLIELNTTDSVGHVTAAAEAIAARLRDASFGEKDVIVAGPTDRKKNLVARLHGTGERKPIL